MARLRPFESRAFVLALVAFATSVALAARSVWHHTRPLPLRRPGSLLEAPPRAVHLPRKIASDAELALAIEKDPFQPSRSRLSHGHDDGTDPSGAIHLANASSSDLQVRVVGTIVSAGGGFAICQMRGAPARVVRLGDTMGNLTLKRIMPGGAIFVSRTGIPLALHVEKAGD